MRQFVEIWIWKAPDAETVDTILIPWRAEYGGRTETLQVCSEAEAAALLASTE